MNKDNTFYNDDVAHVHDTGFGEFARNAAKMIIQTLHEHKIDSGLIVDLGSGSGIAAKVLVDGGYEVLGVDFSAAFVAMAQKKVPQAKFIQGSLFDAEIPPCAAVISTSECFNYLPGKNGADEKSRHLAQLQALFQRVFKALKPGGLFIFDLLEPHSQEPRDKKYIIEGDDWTMFVHVLEDVELQQLIRDVTLFRQVGDLHRKTKELHHVQLYPRDQVLVLLRSCGFDVRIFNQYDSVGLETDHAGFLCKKI